MIFIDPGVHMCGASSFTASGMLVYAGWYTVEETIRMVATAKICKVFIEIPRIYGTAQQKGNQNDLIDLAFSAGRVIGQSKNFEILYPREWKGTMKKEAMTERIIEVARARGEFSVPTLPSAKGKQHNVWDAVGIGYEHFGYINQKKIFRGGESAKR